MVMVAKAASRNRKITIERATLLKNEFGEMVETWGALASVWASFEPVLDGERVRADEMQAYANARFQVRYGIGVLPTDRLIFRGHVWEITGVKEVGYQVAEEISAKARAE